MKKTVTLILVLVALCLLVGNGSALAAQAPKAIKGNIKGVVIDKASGGAMEFATVSVVDTANKVVAGGMTNVKGEFLIDNVQAGSYTFKVSFVGYTDIERFISLSAENTSLQLGKLELAPDSEQLNAVVVSAKRPTVERQMDKLVMTVANTIVAENSTALEVLRKAPGVAIDKDGNVTLNGQNVEVWVDNRPTQLSGQELVALLSGTEGSTLDKIEIIDQPSSKYDAAGSGGIINIKTKKTFLNGFNGSVRAGYAQYLYDEFYYNANGSMNLNYRNDLVNAFVNFSGRGSKGFGDLTENLAADNGYTRNSEMHSVENGFNGNVKAGLDFYIDKKNIIGVIGNYSARNRGTTDNGNTLSHNPLAPVDTSSLFTGDGDNRFTNATGNLNYTHYFDDSDHELTLNGDYMHYAGLNDQRVVTAYTPRPAFDPRQYTNKSDQYTDVFSGKADYVKPFGKNVKLEAGGKMAWSSTDNEINRDDSIPGGWQHNTALSDDYTYKENVGALYASVGWQITPKWSVKGGLRWETTHSEGLWRSADSSTSRNYNDLFPTLFIGFTPAENQTISLSYTKRIRRPNYWQLNPFRRYISDYSYFEGNPDLSPEYSHRLNLSYTGFKVFNAGLMFNYNYDQIVQVPAMDPVTHMSGYTQGNFGKVYYASAWAGLSELPVTKWWSFTANIWGGYNYNESGDYTQSGFQASLYISNTLLFGDNWTGEVEFWGQSPSSWGYFETKARGELTLGIKKTFWDNKASVSLYLDDVLGTNNSDNWSDVNGVYLETSSKWDSRSIRASFSYRFGNAGQTKQRKVGQTEEAERVD